MLRLGGLINRLSSFQDGVIFASVALVRGYILDGAVLVYMVVPVYVMPISA